MGENSLAEMCLINSGIASGNMMMNSQKTMIDQFYRTAGAQGGGFFSQIKGGPNAFQFKASGSSSEEKSNDEDDDDEEEEEEEEKVPYKGKRMDDSF